ncbi:MAG: hypothetical protein F6K00_22880 [Leptolyngbya sp. SIOISBB]|nr:hypothetical protein [Leptolyngbya sp. SIOISBB]
MATRSTLVYSAAAIRRMMGLPASVPVQLREFLDVVWVWVKGDRPTFVSKADFKRHFVERRQAAAESLTVIDWLSDPPRYMVTNPETGSNHLVVEQGDRLDCDCEDYQWQQRFIGRGCCKHGYAVLRYLGFDSLGDFLPGNFSPDEMRPAANA